MSPTLLTPEDLDDFVRAHTAAAVYFAGEACGVCRVLEPKLRALLQERFPEVALARVECARAPELAARRQVFSVPTLIVYLDGREALRRARHFSPAELAEALERPYRLLFEP